MSEDEDPDFAVAQLRKTLAGMQRQHELAAKGIKILEDELEERCARQADREARMAQLMKALAVLEGNA